MPVPPDPSFADGPMDAVLARLEERAKELNCLYRVHDVCRRVDASPDEVCRGLLAEIPLGWRHPAVCWARIVLDGVVYQPPRAAETPWVLRADVVVAGDAVGAIEVFYGEECPADDDGPFLKEEHRLLAAIADRLALWVGQRRLQGLSRPTAPDPGAVEGTRPDRPAWAVIVDFLRQADHHLLMRISRRMLNYLCWNGVDEAQALLQRFSSSLRVGPASDADDNRPVDKTSLDTVLAVVNEAFAIAARHLSDGEILDCLHRWMKDDKSGFLMEAVENLGTSLPDIAAALERYQQLHVTDRNLSRTRQMALRVALVRRFLNDDVDYINTAKQYTEVDDFLELVRRIVAPSGSHGKIGGKGAGLFLAGQVLRRSEETAHATSHVKTPKTWYLSSDALLAFIEFNHLEDVYDRKYLELDQVRREYPHIIQVFKNSDFPPDIARGLSIALDDVDGPLVVRSSSLLEDRVGAAFSGKYKSLFLANQGTKRERLAALMDAVAEVWASIFGPDPIEYRADRGLLDVHEEMGILIQEVVGRRVGHYFLPAYAGVAFSRNEHRWSARIRREDGLVRLVPGLGTRAVDRLSDDYPVLLSPGQPGLRASATPDEVLRYAPRKVDLINLESRRFETVPIDALLSACAAEYPALSRVFSVYDDGRLHPPLGLVSTLDPSRLVATFEGLVAGTSFMPRIRTILRVLSEKLGYPVDIEFASDGTDFYILQCRAQSFSPDAAPAAIPVDLPAERVVFLANRFVSNGRVPDLTHLVYVDPERYHALGDLESLKDVGRAVGRLNGLLPKRQFALLGPGRWGSRGDITLGVSVTYSDINNTALLVEIAARRGQYVPEVSFGTHFFQDLVEADIRYLPIFPDDPEARLADAWLKESPSILTNLLPDYGHLADTLRVIDVPQATGGQVLRVLMNGDVDRAVGLLVTPEVTVRPGRNRRRTEA
ncbi:MAG: pyruvate, phosphate dikinase [Acidobacteria bacterium]|nr:pyruvate, phosphate dikinase [Acidobacteriota bacterium]